MKLWATTGLGSEPDEDAAEITERLRRDPELFVVAVEDGHIVASVMGCYDGHRGFLKRAAVTPEHQGTGLGRLIVEEVERRFASQGITKLRLTVADDNAGGLAFWAALGYVDATPHVRWHEKTLDSADVRNIGAL